jgi:hypothetical protein
VTGHFSASPVWISSSIPDEPRAFVEIGIMKQDNGDNSGTPFIYTFCGNCYKGDRPDGTGEGGNSWPDPPSGWRQLRKWRTPQDEDYFVVDHRGTGQYAKWRIFLNDQLLDEIVASRAGKSDRIRVGGETTQNTADMGVQYVFDVQVMEDGPPYVWDMFTPENTDRSKWEYAWDGAARGRYASFYGCFYGYQGASVAVVSDVHYHHLGDACGGSP